MRIRVHQTILVVDAMTGQDAVNVAEMFNQKIGIDGVILTKVRRRYQRRCGPVHQSHLPENRFCMLVWEKSFRIWNSFIRTGWLPEFWVWEM